MELRLNKEEKIEYYKGYYIVPVIDENGNKFNLSMSYDDMHTFFETAKLYLTDTCSKVKH